MIKTKTQRSIFRKLRLRSVFSNILVSPRSFLTNIMGKTKIENCDYEDIRNFEKFINASYLHACNYNVAKTKKILIVSMLPIPYWIKMESILAKALELRGYHIEILTNLASYNLVSAYHSQINRYQIHLLEDYVSIKNNLKHRHSLKELFRDNEELTINIKKFKYCGCLTGLHSLATLSADIMDGQTELSVSMTKKLEKILRQSMRLSDASKKIISNICPDIILSVEKGFVGTAEIFYAGMNEGIDYVQWVSCHEPDSVMLKRYSWSNYREHPFSISEQNWLSISKLNWNNQHSSILMEKISEGYKQGNWYRYKKLAADQRYTDQYELVRRLKLDPCKKNVIIYSHILNDANLFYGKDLFGGGYKEWLIETIRAASQNSNVNWILKLHPSNIYRNAQSGYSGEYGEILALKNAFVDIPGFLHLVLPDDEASPLSFYAITDYAVTVRGTVGLELPCYGIVTLTAGSGRYAGKGFTCDSNTIEEYLYKIKNIDNLPPLTDNQIKLAHLYSFFAFNKRPARYGNMFSDVYQYPLSHSRHRDIKFTYDTFDKVLKDPQMEKIVSFLMSNDEDFINMSIV